MTDFTFSKTLGSTLLAAQKVTSGSIIIGSAVAVTAALSALASISFGRNNGTALTNEVIFRLQGRAAGSSNDQWIDLVSPWSSSSGKTAGNSTTLSASITANDATFSVTSATGIAKGSKLFIQESTAANSEWLEVASISGTTVTPLNNVVRSHASGNTLTTLHERFFRQINIQAIKDVRLIVDGGTNTSGQDFWVEAWLSTLDKAVGA